MVKNASAYDKATQKLALQAMDFDLEPVGKFSFPEIVIRLREAFKQKLTYKKVFDELPPKNADPSTGFCLVSSYYIYENTGGEAVWKLMKSPIHWWLQSEKHSGFTGVFDVTYTQFNTAFPYDSGTVENKIKNDPEFLKLLKQKAMILGKAAGLE